jgi:uncharacterized coiled-coil protein SlyX
MSITVNNFLDAVGGYLKCSGTVSSTFDESVNIISTSKKEKYSPTLTIGDKMAAECAGVIEFVRNANEQPVVAIGLKGHEPAIVIDRDGAKVNGLIPMSCTMCSEDPSYLNIYGTDESGNGPMLDVGRLRFDSGPSEQYSVAIKYNGATMKDVMRITHGEQVDVYTKCSVHDSLTFIDEAHKGPDRVIANVRGELVTTDVNGKAIVLNKQVDLTDVLTRITALETKMTEKDNQIASLQQELTQKTTELNNVNAILANHYNAIKSIAEDHGLTDTDTTDGSKITLGVMNN